MADTPDISMVAQSRRFSVEERLRQLEEEQARLRQELTMLAGGELRLPGMYLTVDAAGTSALMDTESVQEVVRLVELEPLPGAPEHVAGTFVYRGSPAVVVDLAALLGVKREASLDAHLVVCGGARTVALLVDRVRDLVESPVLVDGTPDGSEPLPWDASGLMAGLCRTPEGVRPLLRMSAVLVSPEAP